MTIILAAATCLLAACSQRNPAYSQHDGWVSPDAGPREDGQVFADTGRSDVWTPPPPDQGAASCTSNDQCTASEYCKFASGCGMAGPGSCAPRPTGGCPEYYFPVCGCDDKTYGSECEAASVGVSLAHTGECKNKQKLCNDLNNTYVAAVQAAKVCAPMLPVVQCQLQVDSALHCGCPTYVDQGNTTAVNALKKAKQDFDAAGCIPYQCGMPCAQPQPGNCAPDPSGAGRCM